MQIQLYRRKNRRNISRRGKSAMEFTTDQWINISIAIGTFVSGAGTLAAVIVALRIARRPGPVALEISMYASDRTSQERRTSNWPLHLHNQYRSKHRSSQIHDLVNRQMAPEVVHSFAALGRTRTASVWTVLYSSNKNRAEISAKFQGSSRIQTSKGQETINSPVKDYNSLRTKCNRHSP